MDERDSIFSVSGKASGSAPEQKYIPKHEKPAQEQVPPSQDQPSPPPPQQQAPPPQPKAVRPKYDAFMFEPIGFDEYDRMTAAETKAAEEKRLRRERSRREKLLVLLFVLLLLIAAGLAAYGIVSDVMRGRRLGGSISSDQPVLILYQSKKPEGANELANMQDENGRYTTEGAAAAVRPSIVEIYTYADSLHNELLGTGSGIVISDEGSDAYIVTNAHVLQSDGYHTIHTVDGEVFSAKIVGRDVKTDIAVIRVNSSKLEPAVLGDSDEMLVGEQVIAIGNPAGLSSTVTDGIVSAVSRKIKSDSTGFEMDCIQTDAAISPGNSGGALVNMYGQVIGITSSKYVNSKYEGLGFAITINEAMPIIEELIQQGYISGRFRIGVTLIDMDGEAKLMSIESDLGFALPEGFTGIYITSLAEDCDISKTDLKPKDFITAINGQSVKTYSEFYETISSMYGAGDVVPATCAHLEKDKEPVYYNIEFRLMEDTSGNY
ncbi:MAG: trypsin-like peptidase domain-containing protein [Ruminococcus sp.]|nr:trypsin-like peptidase domain-containing protein [Ruminococcus sp.]